MSDKLAEYNNFCSSLKEGDILYNLNTSNRWGSLFLVSAKITISTENADTFALLLLSLKLENDYLHTDGKRIDITPQMVYSVPFLKVVGHCEYSLIPDIDKCKINKGLLTAFQNTDIRNMGYRKPKISKYGDDGNPIIKSTNNK